MKHKLLVLVLLTTLGCFGGLLSRHYLITHSQYDDFARKNGDEMAYHSLAINMMLGHGFTEGLVDQKVDYRFLDISETGEPSSSDYPPNHNFLRTPGYPQFLATIYMTNGIHPLLAKEIQCAIFCFATFLLPLAGWVLLGTNGLWAGAISIPFVFRMHHLFNLNELYTETLQLFSLLLIAVVWALVQRYKYQGFLMSLLGFACFYSLMVKGASLFLPPLFLAYFLFKYLSGILSRSRIVAFVIFLALPLACWSAYASLKCGRPILLSTQPESVLLGGNNELSLHSGTFEYHHHYYENPRFISAGMFEKLSTFYQENLDQIPRMISNKIRIILYDIPYPGFLLCYFVFLIALQYCLWLENRRDSSPWVIIVYAILCCFVLCHAGVAHKLHTWICAAALIATLALSHSRKISLWVDIRNYSGLYLSVIYFLSISLISIILYGYRRFSAPYHYFTILTSFFLPVVIARYWISSCRSSLFFKKIKTGPPTPA